MDSFLDLPLWASLLSLCLSGSCSQAYHWQQIPLNLNKQTLIHSSTERGDMKEISLWKALTNRMKRHWLQEDITTSRASSLIDFQVDSAFPLNRRYLIFPINRNPASRLNQEDLPVPVLANRWVLPPLERSESATADQRSKENQKPKIINNNNHGLLWLSWCTAVSLRPLPLSKAPLNELIRTILALTGFSNLRFLA